MIRSLLDSLEALCCPSIGQRSHYAREGRETSGLYEARSGAQAAYNSRRQHPPRKDQRATDPRDADYNYEGGNPELQKVVGGQRMSSFPQSTQPSSIPVSHGRSPNRTSLTISHYQPYSGLPVAGQFMRTIVPPEGTDPEGSEARQSNGQVANLDEGQAMDRIFQTLHQLRLEVPSTHFTREITRQPDNIEMGINDVISAYRSVCLSTKQLGDRVTTLDAARESFQPTFDDELNRKDQIISKLNEEVEKRDEEVRKLNEEVDKLREKVEEKKNDNLMLTGRLSALTESNDARERRYETRESSIRGQHQRDKEALTESHRVKLTAVEEKARQDLQQAQAQVNQMSRQNAKNKNDLEQGFDKQTKLSEKKHRNEILALQSRIQLANDHGIQQINQHEKDSQRKITEIETSHKSKKLEMIQDREQAEEGFRQQIVQLEQERNRKVNDIKNMEAENKAEIVKMRANCEAEKIAYVRGLKETVEILKMELARRDHFKAMSDRELANRFKEIANEVDDFSRYPWEKDQEPSWPFPLHLVLSSEKNERVTKQEIMQNTLWVILYKNIFCTPFRVLGEKGKALELEWVHQDKGSSGAAALCPRPTKASEKWRYETMKECVEAITEPGIVVKANRNVKGGYELTLKEIADALSHELARVALVDTNDKQRMGLLVTKAAQLWLEVGQQRSRMYLLMSNSGHEPAQSSPTSLNRDGRMELVVVPEVRRKGNVQGDRLGEDELVSDCKGEFSIFPGR